MDGTPCITLILYLLRDNVVHKADHTLCSIIISYTNTSPEHASKQYVIMFDKSKVKSDHLHLQNHRPAQINNCSAGLQEREGRTPTTALAAESGNPHIFSLRLPSRRPLTHSKASIEREVSKEEASSEFIQDSIFPPAFLLIINSLSRCPG